MFTFGIFNMANAIKVLLGVMGKLTYNLHKSTIYACHRSGVGGVLFSGGGDKL